MRPLSWALVAVLAIQQNSISRQKQDQPQPAQPTRYVFPAGTQPRSHGHPPETAPGTPPCGTRYADCPPRKDPPPRHDPHDGRNIAIGVGAGLFAGVVITSLAHSSEPASKLSNNGPQFSPTVHMSMFQVTGFVKGGWPLVIDYEAAAGSYAVLTVVAQDAPPYSVLLPTQQPNRRLEILQLPFNLGNGLKIATFTVSATVSQYDPALRYFRVYGFGCGPKAVGSVAIDQLRFSPSVITSAQSDAQFSFHAHADFDRMKAEFMQVALVDNCLEGTIFDNKKIDRRIQEGEHWSDDWNGKKARPGQIQFRVRGWMTGENGGDWVSAFSPDLVLKK